MHFIGEILMVFLNICFWIIIAQVVFSWLITFEVVNIRNPSAANFIRLLDRITAPVYRPLRRVIPPIAGIDVTPIIVIFAIGMLQKLVEATFFV